MERLDHFSPGNANPAVFSTLGTTDVEKTVWLLVSNYAKSAMDVKVNGSSLTAGETMFADQITSFNTLYARVYRFDPAQHAAQFDFSVSASSQAQLTGAIFITEGFALTPAFIDWAHQEWSNIDDSVITRTVPANHAIAGKGGMYDQYTSPSLAELTFVNNTEYRQCSMWGICPVERAGAVFTTSRAASSNALAKDQLLLGLAPTP